MKRWGVLLSCGILLGLAGCDGGRDDAALILAPEYDLTGCWEVREQPFCEASVMPAAELQVSGIDYVDAFSDEELDEIERDFVDAEPLRLRVDGNDLEITDTGSGLRIDGSVTGDQVRYRDTEELLGFETVWEGRGTALSADLVVLTYTHEFSSEEVDGALVCEMRLERMANAPPTCVAESGG